MSASLEFWHNFVNHIETINVFASSRINAVGGNAEYDMCVSPQNYL